MAVRFTSKADKLFDFALSPSEARFSNQDLLKLFGIVYIHSKTISSSPKGVN